MPQDKTSVVDLTFASEAQSPLIANVKSKTTLESYIRWCPFDPNIRNMPAAN